MLEQVILGIDWVSLGWDMGKIFGGAVFGAAVAILVFASKGFFTEAGKRKAEKLYASDLAELRERGKNQATKDNIEEITNKIEAVKNTLSDESYFRRIREEQERLIYQEVWEALVRLNESSGHLIQRKKKQESDEVAAADVTYLRSIVVNQIDTTRTLVTLKLPFVDQKIRNPLTEVAASLQVALDMSRETGQPLPDCVAEVIHGSAFKLVNQGIQDRLNELSITSNNT